MASLLDIGNELKKFFGGASKTAQNVGSFIQKNPIPAAYANQQFQRNIAQPLAQGLSEAGKTYLNAIPPTLSLSPPGQLRSSYQNLVTNQSPVKNLQTQFSNVAKSAPLVFGTIGATGTGGISRFAKTAIPNALLTGGISKFTGGSFLKGVGQGIGTTPQITGVTKLSNPFIQKTIGKSIKNVNNPVIKNLSSRIGTGLLNIPEGAVIGSSLGRPSYTPADAAFDFGVGAILGNGTEANAKGVVNKEPMSPNNIRRTIDFITEHDDISRDKTYSLEQSGKLNNLESKIRSLAAEYIDKTFAKTRSIEEVKQELFNRVQVDTESPFKMGILDNKEAKKIENTPQSQMQQIIDEGRSQIGRVFTEDKRSIRQVADDLYTQWVDRFNPIVKASEQARSILKKQGAELRPENDPSVLVRRLTGAGGIADTRFQRKLKPVLDQIDSLKIDKLDLDTYLANRRIAGFGEVGRDIYGADTQKAQQIVSALEAKYGDSIKGIADKLYAYQNQGFQEMIDAGFLSPESAKIIQQQNPDYAPLKRVMDEVNNYLGIPSSKTMQGSSPIQKIKGSKRKIESPLESIIGNTFIQRAAIEKNRVARSVVDLQNISPELGFKKVAKSGADTITTWVDGKKQYWQVGKDIADVAKGANEESMNLVLKLLQKPASLLRQGATGRNPEFMIPNIIRDQLDAGISSKYGYIPFVDYFSGLKSMLTNDDVYKKWESSGAKIDLGEISGKKSIQKLFDEKTKKKNLFNWISAGLDVAGKYSEQPTRVGLFKKAYQKTGNEALAMMESRDATLDFARMGSKMKVANSIIPFLNVGVQGFDKLIRSIKNNHAKVGLMMAAYATAPQVATQIYNLQNFPQEYAEIPQWVKDSNFILVKGRNENGTVDYLTFPKGNITPIASNPVQSFIDYAYKVDGQSFGQMATSLFSDTLPLLSGGSTPKEVAIKTIGSNIPQAFKPAAENLLNKSFFKYDPNKEQSKEIVPYYLQKNPPAEQAYEFTPVMYKKIGALLNTSPLLVQNAMEGYLAGYTKIPSQIVEMAYKASRGEEIAPNDKTILRRFIQQTYPNSKTSQVATPEAPGLMERLFGKVKAAEGITPEGKILKEKKDYSRALSDYKDYLTGDLKVKDISSYLSKNYGVDLQKVDDDVKTSLIKDKVRETGVPAETKDGIVYLNDGGSISTLKKPKDIAPPKKTGIAEIDKKAIASFKSDITSMANYVYKLYELGKISEEEAQKQLDELKKMSGSYSSKPKKITAKKVSFKTFQVKNRPKTSQIKLSSTKTPTIKPISISKVKLSPQIRSVAKAKKIKGLTVGKKLV